MATFPLDCHLWHNSLETSTQQVSLAAPSIHQAHTSRGDVTHDCSHIRRFAPLMLFICCFSSTLSSLRLKHPMLDIVGRYRLVIASPIRLAIFTVQLRQLTELVPGSVKCTTWSLH